MTDSLWFPFVGQCFSPHCDLRMGTNCKTVQTTWEKISLSCWLKKKKVFTLAFGMIFMDIFRRVLKTDLYFFLIMIKRSYTRLVNCTGTACVGAVSKVVYLP